MSKTILILLSVFFLQVNAEENQEIPLASHVNISSENQFTPWYSQIGMLYAGQWAYYLVFQKENIEKHGSLKNWKTGFYSPHFDKDSYDYNLLLHTGAGALYYQYYRSFGHSKPASLGYSTLSVLLFEFSIETITEPPSIQDIYQTPVFGALLGMLWEDTSIWLLSNQNTFSKILGHTLNPFTLLPTGAWKIHWAPVISNQSSGGLVSVQF